MAKRSGKAKGLDPSLFGCFEVDGLWIHPLGDGYRDHALSSKQEFEAAVQRERAAQARGAREAQVFAVTTPKRREGGRVVIHQTRTRVEEF